MASLLGELVKNKLKRVGKGLVNELPIVGSVKANVQSPDGGKGKVDTYQLVGTLLIPLALIGLLAFGVIDKETLEWLYGLFGD